MQLPIVTYFAISAVILPTLVGLLVFNRLEKDLKLLFGLFSFHSILTIMQFIMAFHRINNLWTSHVYYLVEVVILCHVFSNWAGSPGARRIFSWLSLAYVVFWTVIKVSVESFATWALYTPTVSRILLIGLSLHVLMVLAAKIEIPLYREPRFWFAAGFLVLFSGSLMYYGFRTLILQFSFDAMNTALTVNWVNTIFSNSLHIIGFLCILRLPNTGGQLALAR